MLWSTNMQKLNLKFLTFWAVQKWQTLKDCEILKIHYYRCQNLLFFAYLKFKLKICTIVDHNIVCM
jgi:hypothetical protein